MRKICLHQFGRAFTSPRIYVALLVGCVMQILSIMPLLDFSKSINKSLCIFEGFIYFNCDTYIASAAFLGLVLLVSDIPFSTQNETYTLLRVSRKQWIWGKVLYLFLVCLFYYFITFVAGILFISPNAYWGNFWSEPIYSLARDSGTQIAVNANAYFPYNHILLGLTPVRAIIVSFLLSVSYGFVMSMIIFLLNLKLSRTISYGAAMMIHVVGYLIAALFVSFFYMKFSLLGNSLLMYHDIDGYYKGTLFTTIPQSFAIYIVLAVLLLLLLFKAIKTYDFRVTVGVK